jgi:uncharacterized membrane protein YfhO
VLESESESESEFESESESESASASASASASEVRLLAYSTDALELSVDAPSAGYVVVNELHYPGWRATVGGRPSIILRANALVRAVHVPRGRHRVELRYAPSGVRALRILALVVLALSLLALAVAKLR